MAEMELWRALKEKPEIGCSRNTNDRVRAGFIEGAKKKREQIM